MPQSYTSLNLHIVFSTKRRQSWITPEIDARGEGIRERRVHPIRHVEKSERPGYPGWPVVPIGTPLPQTHIM